MAILFSTFYVLGRISWNITLNKEGHRSNVQHDFHPSGRFSPRLSFYRTRVRSLAMLVTHSLTDWLNDSLTHSLPFSKLVTNSLTDSLTNSLLFSKLDWCDPGVWRCQLKTCWCCNCCWWGSCWQQFVAEVWSSFWIWSSGKISSWSLASFFCWCFEEVMKVNLGWDSKARFGQDFEA